MAVTGECMFTDDINAHFIRYLSSLRDIQYYYINISCFKLKNRDMTDVETYMINNKYIIIYRSVEYGNEDIYKRN